MIRKMLLIPEYNTFLSMIGIDGRLDEDGNLSNAALSLDNRRAFSNYLSSDEYAEDFLAAKEWFDILRSHGFQLPTKKVDKLIQIHKSMSNLK